MCIDDGDDDDDDADGVQGAGEVPPFKAGPILGAALTVPLAWLGRLERPSRPDPGSPWFGSGRFGSYRFRFIPVPVQKI